MKKAVKTKISVSELNIRKAATRLLTVKLVSTEIGYVQRVLGNTATQEEIDEKVLAVRRMPWNEIALAD
jgi:hypothetical protein